MLCSILVRACIYFSPFCMVSHQFSVSRESDYHPFAVSMFLKEGKFVSIKVNKNCSTPLSCIPYQKLSYTTVRDKH